MQNLVKKLQKISCEKVIQKWQSFDFYYWVQKVLSYKFLSDFLHFFQWIRTQHQIYVLWYPYRISDEMFFSSYISTFC